MYTLTEQQRKYLIMLLDIQDKYIWNNGRQFTLLTIINKESYNDIERKDLNEMNDAYKKFLENRRNSGNPNYTEWP